MSLHTWWLFVATVFVVSAIPGPNMLLVMTHGAQHGLRRSGATMAGCLSALVLMLSDRPVSEPRVCAVVPMKPGYTV